VTQEPGEDAQQADHELEVLEADEDVPPRPEEAAADLADDKATQPTKGG
jgi:hypothetical protein